MSLKDLLIQNNFKETTKSFVLKSGNSKFVLEKEKAINTKYTAMKYTIESTSGTMSGLLYTNSFERFTVSFKKLIHHFKELAAASIIIESKASFLRKLMKDTYFKATTENVYSYKKDSKTFYELILNEAILEVQLVKVSNEETLVLHRHLFPISFTAFDFDKEMSLITTLINTNSFTQDFLSVVS